MKMEEEQKRLAEELLFSEKKQPSFAKRLYFGNFEANQVFPFPYPSVEEQKVDDQFLAKLKTFAEEKVDPVWNDRNAEIPDSVKQGLAELGVLGMTVPKKYGGLGMSQYAYCRAEELLSSRCGSTALFVSVHQSIGLKALLLFGTEEQKQRWLPSLAKGQDIAAFSLTEPNAGSDANGIETRAVFDPKRNIYIINGRKQWTTNGSIATVLTLMAKTEVETPRGREEKVTAFLVTPDMPGFIITNPGLEKLGFRGTRTTNLEFKNLEVPAANVLGKVGGGLKICLTVLDYGRTTFGAICTGSAKFLLEHATQHAINRYQFKRPLASFALVKKKIALMSALTYAMDATTYLTAGFIDSGVEDIMLESAMLKVFASDSLWSILYDTMQIFGGRSFFTNEPYERMMRDARLSMIGEGSNEVMRAFIGAVGMRDVGMLLKSGVDGLGNPFKNRDQIRDLTYQLINYVRSPKIPIKSKLLSYETSTLASNTRRFSVAIVQLLAKYGEDIVEQQIALDRISTMAMALYTTSAVLSKIDTDLQKVNGDAQMLGNDLEIAKLYCHHANDLIEYNLKSISKNNDTEIESLSDKITGVKI